MPSLHSILYPVDKLTQGIISQPQCSSTVPTRLAKDTCVLLETQTTQTKMLRPEDTFWSVVSVRGGDCKPR